MRQRKTKLISACTKFIFFYDTETNQELITTQSGITLLSSMANVAIDPQTMRMVAGAIANLCGNGIVISCFLHSHQ